MIDIEYLLLKVLKFKKMRIILKKFIRSIYWMMLIRYVI